METTTEQQREVTIPTGPDDGVVYIAAMEQDNLYFTASSCVDEKGEYMELGDYLRKMEARIIEAIRGR